MSRSRLLAPARLRRSRPPVVGALSESLRTRCKIVLSRLAGLLQARRHARDLAEMTDRMRADIGLPPQPPEIRQRQTWSHAPGTRHTGWPGPQG